MSKIIRLSQALNAKLCHDLAGSIGTVNNCLELIDNSNKEISEKSKELAILESENLVKKIQPKPEDSSTVSLTQRNLQTIRETCVAEIAMIKQLPHLEAQLCSKNKLLSLILQSYSHSN